MLDLDMEVKRNIGAIVFVAVFVRTTVGFVNLDSGSSMFLLISLFEMGEVRFLQLLPYSVEYVYCGYFMLQ